MSWARNSVLIASLMTLPFDGGHEIQLRPVDPMFDLLRFARPGKQRSYAASPGGRAHRRWRVRRWAGKNGR